MNLALDISHCASKENGATLLYPLPNNRARPSERISDVYILPMPRRQRAAQATIATKGDKVCDVSTVPLVARWPVFLARGSDADGEPHYATTVLSGHKMYTVVSFQCASAGEGQAHQYRFHYDHVSACPGVQAIKYLPEHPSSSANWGCRLPISCFDPCTLYTVWCINKGKFETDTGVVQFFASSTQTLLSFYTSATLALPQETACQHTPGQSIGRDCMHKVTAFWIGSHLDLPQNDSWCCATCCWKLEHVLYPATCCTTSKTWSHKPHTVVTCCAACYSVCSRL